MPDDPNKTYRLCEFHVFNAMSTFLLSGRIGCEANSLLERRMIVDKDGRKPLRIKDEHFVDEHGRIQILRGVNLGGSSKLPYGYLHDKSLEKDWDTTRKRFFDDHQSVSFVNRPFPLQEADEHFRRMHRWGLTCIRLVTTWEAIEHAGPGIYDEKYLDYIREIILIGAKYDLYFYIDPHQDVWSRWTGGDGAPMWTLQKVGLEPRNFAETHASICIETLGDHVHEFPKMIWPTNYFKFASATMFTLFFGGSTFAPSCFVEDESGNRIQVQEYLQMHYINAFVQLAKRLEGIQNVIGIGTMNEPSFGFIGVKDLSKCYLPHQLNLGYAPSPFQGMCLADGFSQKIPFYSTGIRNFLFNRPDRVDMVNKKCLRAWSSGVESIWKREGVYGISTNTKEPRLLQPHYFDGKDFGKDFYVPFAQKFMHSIRQVLPGSLAFVELPPLEFSQTAFPTIDHNELPFAINATHWYDGFTLFTRAWAPYFSVDPSTRMPAFGRASVARQHIRQLLDIKTLGLKRMQNAPTLIGETGIPYNLNNGKAYRTKDYYAQIEAMDHTISCLEANMLSYTLWCYSCDNTHGYGDGWNVEDLSIVHSNGDAQAAWSRKMQAKNGLADKIVTKDISAESDALLSCSGRAITAFVRPGPLKIAGVPLQSHFDLRTGRYHLAFKDPDDPQQQLDDPSLGTVTELYIPHLQYPKGFQVTTSDGEYVIEPQNGWDRLLYTRSHNAQRLHHVTITSKDPGIRERIYKEKCQLRILQVWCVIVMVTTVCIILFIQ
uniref:Uncharacterized protein AlNc14C1G102 n=1 Tax=Albugo laibachii Nc14 TaxID=890382 RepID=F0VYV1_9STRA|nr:conserved hypothetical protein [Albugo laibachii Nc14]|eukprot:CCA13966.1 conserved hypothetical protein [Albugo laibachii Nc14]